MELGGVPVITMILLISSATLIAKENLFTAWNPAKDAWVITSSTLPSRGSVAGGACCCCCSSAIC